MSNGFKASTANNECLGVVLAGGLSSRMGSDKAHLLRNSNTMLSMLEFSRQTLADSGIKNIVISGDKYDVPDAVKESGPVGGIHSVLSMFPQVKSLLILPVDLPFMTSKALADLRVKGELSQKATSFKGHNIPLYLPINAYVELFLTKAFSLSSNNKSNKLNEEEKFGLQLKKRGPSIKALLEQVPSQSIQSSDETVLFNTNTPEQWQQAKQQFNFK